MWSSKEITLVIIFAAISLIYSATVIQIPKFLTGIIGLGYILGFGMVIILNVAFLSFEGSRWKFISVVIIERMLLSVILVYMGPTIFIKSIPLFAGKFIQDVIFNTIYGYFKKRNKLLWLTIIFSVTGLILDVIFRILLFPFLISPEYTTSFIGTVSIMFPLIIFNGLFGGFLGHQIYNRIKSSSILQND
ncbi:MAG: hypothetical protein P8Y18_11750 [Candidatus Bathyarchaeota archaeon]